MRDTVIDRMSAEKREGLKKAGWITLPEMFRRWPLDYDTKNENGCYNRGYVGFWTERGLIPLECNKAELDGNGKEVIVRFYWKKSVEEAMDRYNKIQERKAGKGKKTEKLKAQSTFSFGTAPDTVTKAELEGIIARTVAQTIAQTVRALRPEPKAFELEGLLQATEPKRITPSEQDAANLAAFEARANLANSRG